MLRNVHLDRILSAAADKCSVVWGENAFKDALAAPAVNAISISVPTVKLEVKVSATNVLIIAKKESDRSKIREVVGKVFMRKAQRDAFKQAMEAAAAETLKEFEPELVSRLDDEITRMLNAP